MWGNILTKPLQHRALREFKAELMNFPGDYKDKSTSEDVGDTTGVPVRNGIQTGKPNAHYRSYNESTRATIKSSMASPQEFRGGTQIPEVPGRSQITGLQIAT